MSFSLNNLYKVLSISKQAVGRFEFRQQEFELKLENLLLDAEELRKEHPGCGVEKMYYTLKPDFIGRDRFIEMFMQFGFRLKKKLNYRRTTYASRVCYPNLIKGITVNSPNTVWQTDITYIEVEGDFYYAVFIIDVYTKEIVGYNFDDNMRVTSNITALKTALKTNGTPQIHHSDRGSQYTCNEYVKMLIADEIKISMALSAQDNAYAERINRTIKEEYLNHWKLTVKNCKSKVKKAVENYNNKRPHNNLNRMTPMKFKEYVLSLPKEQRPITKIYNNEVV